MILTLLTLISQPEISPAGEETFPILFESSEGTSRRKLFSLSLSGPPLSQVVLEAPITCLLEHGLFQLRPFWVCSP
jgi:hypothetical protein